MDPTVFPFRFHPAFRVAAMPFGVRPHNCFVSLADGELVASFGPWSLRTSLRNVVGVTVSENYSWPKSARPDDDELAERSHGPGQRGSLVGR